MFFGWGLLRVSGQSMGSIIKDGDYALTKLVSKRDKLNTGDVLQVDHPNFGMIVKFVRKTKNEKVLLSGTSVFSTEPMTIGWVHRSKVISRLLIKISGNGMSSIKRCSQG
jgi:hypothetical protein